MQYPFSGERVMASKASVDTLAIFARPQAPRKCLLGSLPKPRRRRKLHIPRPAVNGRAYSFRCASSPHANPVCAGTPLWDKVSHRSVCGMFEFYEKSADGHKIIPALPERHRKYTIYKGF